MEMKPSVWVAFILALVILAIIGAVSIYNTRELVSSSNLVGHSHDVLSAINDVFDDVREAESARRGYALTNRDTQLTILQTALKNLDQDEQHLRSLVSDNPDQTQRVDHLVVLISARVKLLRELVAGQQQGTLSAQGQMQGMFEGQALTEQIASLLGEMDSQERRLLAQRETVTNERARNTVLVEVAGTCFAFALLILVFVLLQRQIISRTKAEQALRAQSETLSRQARLLDLTHDSIFLRDANGDVVRFWNRGSEDLYGWKAKEAIGRGSHELLKTVFPKPLDEIRAELMENDHWEGELTHTRRDGTRIVVASRWALDRDENGAPVAVLEINNNITERKRTEERLRESEERFRLLADNVKDYGIMFLDTEGNVLSWNVGAERIKGYRADEVIGRNYSLFFTEEDLRAGKPEELLELAAKNGRHEEEGLRRRKHGGVFWADAIITALRDERGKLVGFSKITRDISERKKAEEEKARAAEELRRSNVELQQFAYVASHDLQEPLRMVASYTQLLARRYKGQLDEDADEFITFAVDGARRMQDLIQDLLAYSRVGSRGKEFAPTDMNAVFRRAAGNLEATITEQQASVTSDELPQVMGDETQLVQLMQNLISNGIKFHGEEAPRVHVSARRDNGKWLFSVADNGIGIEPAHAERIFVIFQRLHTREEYSGTGIGLAICRKIVERHRGRIWVDSAPGKGSTFYFTMPQHR